MDDFPTLQPFPSCTFITVTFRTGTKRKFTRSKMRNAAHLRQQKLSGVFPRNIKKAASEYFARKNSFDDVQKRPYKVEHDI